MQYPLPPGELDPRESLPPRETSIKPTTVKPGADVKREDGKAPTPSRPEPAPVLAPPASRRWMIVVALLLAIIVTGIVLAMAGGASGTRSDQDIVGPDVGGQQPQRVTVARTL